MKKIVFTIIPLLLCLLVTSCKNKQTKEDKIKEFQSSLTAADTTAMLEIADNCMELLKAGKTDEAIGMLNEYDDSTNTVLPLSTETAKRYKKLYSMFPVFEYSRVYFSFQLEGLNDVKYNVQFAKDDETAQTSFMFNPVKVEDKWYLTVKRADQEIDLMHQ